MSGEPRPAQSPRVLASLGAPADGDRGPALVTQLEHILESDPLINELGFVHPTQLAALNSQSSTASSSNNIQKADKLINEDVLVSTVPLYDETVFWNHEHKLAISVAELPQLYSTVLQLFVNSFKKYKISSEHVLKDEVLRHSRLLLLLSCDFVSAWNSRSYAVTILRSKTVLVPVLPLRKLVISRNPGLSLFMDELRLSALVLSYSPKSESSWGHRRWVIRNIAWMAGNSQKLSEIVEHESELVKRIAEKSKMNYRAWNYRGWLVSYMSRIQVLDELNKSRKWAELHVADNCCFHFRRRLMLKLRGQKSTEQFGVSELTLKSDMYTLWKDELKWNQSLIQRYVGREALWVHHRFLSQLWLIDFADNHCYNRAFSASNCEDLDITAFLQKEFQLVLCCLSTAYAEFEDDHIQTEQATSYFFWILKHVPQSHHSLLQNELERMGDLKRLLRKFCSEKTTPMWKNLLAGTVYDDLIT